MSEYDYKIREDLSVHNYQDIVVSCGDKNRFVMFKETSGDGWFENQGSNEHGLKKLLNSICCTNQEGYFCDHCFAGINGNVIYVGLLKNKESLNLID